MVTQGQEPRRRRVRRWLESWRWDVALTILLTATWTGCGSAQPPPAPSMDWSSWTIRREPVLQGQYNIAGDPSLVVEGGVYRMFYTCVGEHWIDKKKGFDGRPGICQATSRDGLKWDHAAGMDEPKVKGLTLRGREGKWDRNLEVNYVIKLGGEYWLYYSGYLDKGVPRGGFPAHLGLARSTEGVNFVRVSEEPVLKPTPGWYDNDAIYSPTIVQKDGTLYMVYAGHCYTRCTKATNVSLVGATSRDGIKWQKREEPVLTASKRLRWMDLGVGEPHLMEGPDGMFYLFFTGLHHEDRVIGVARGPAPFGPWEINPTPIVTPNPIPGFSEKAVLAPWVRVEGDVVRMWYMGADFQASAFRIRYAESRWPLRR